MLGKIYDENSNDDDLRIRRLTNSLDLDSNPLALQEDENKLFAQSSSWFPADYTGQETEGENFSSSQDNFFSDLGGELTTSNIDLEEQPVEQIELGLDTNRITQVGQLKENVRRWETAVAVIPFWRNALHPVNITFAIITVIVIALMLYTNLNAISNSTDMPLFYSQVKGTWGIVDTSIFFLLPIVIAVIQIFILRLKRAVFNFDRRLGSVIAITQIFCNVLLITAFLQIISLRLT